MFMIVLYLYIHTYICIQHNTNTMFMIMFYILHTSNTTFNPFTLCGLLIKNKQFKTKTKDNKLIEV